MGQVSNHIAQCHARYASSISDRSLTSPHSVLCSFPVTIESTADLLLRGPYQLLLHNGALLYPLLWPSTKPRARQ